MKTNKKFASKYLQFCKRVQKFSSLKSELDSEIENMESLTAEPQIVNFSKRSQAKLRKFSEQLGDAVKQAEEIEDSAEDLVTEAQAANFSKVSMVKILRREFSNLESELKNIASDVKEVIDEAAVEGEVTSHESAEPAQPGTEQPATPTGVAETQPVNPPAPEVVAGDATPAKKVSVNFSKDKYLGSKMKEICSAYKNFSEDFENSGDIIEEVTDEITLDEQPTEEPVPTEQPTEPAPVEEPAPAEDVPVVDDSDKVAEVAEGIAEDVESDEFDADAAEKELEDKEFSAKKSVLKVIKAFSRIKKHFDEKVDAIKANIDSTATVQPSELTSEEAESLTSEFKAFTNTHEDQLSKRLTKKFSNFSKVLKNYSENSEEVKTADVVEAAEDVADSMDAVEESPTEFKEFSKKIRKFVKMFSAEAQPTPKEVISNEPTEEVAVAASEEVIKKDAELNSTLDTINGRIEKLDLPANVTNFAKLSSKSLSTIKCFSEQDVDNKLKLIEEFAEFCKEFCDKKNFGEGEVCPKCGKTPCECPHEEPAPTGEVTPPTEQPTEPAPTEENAGEGTQEQPSEPTEEVITEEFSDDDDDEEVEEVVVDAPVEENAPVEEPAPAEATTEAPVEEPAPAEEPTPTEEVVETPSDDEVVLKNFSRKGGENNNNYGSAMARLAIMH